MTIRQHPRFERVDQEGKQHEQNTLDINNHRESIVVCTRPSSSLDSTLHGRYVIEDGTCPKRWVHFRRNRNNVSRRKHPTLTCRILTPSSMSFCPRLITPTKPLLRGITRLSSMSPAWVPVHAQRQAKGNTIGDQHNQVSPTHSAIS